MFFKKEELTREQKISQMQIDEMKRLRRKESTEKARKAVGFIFKNITPKGIRNPNDMVRNAHLYVGGRGKTRLY